MALPLGYFYVLDEDQKARILSLFDLEADLLGTGWQQWQGRIALANGGLFGKGLFKGDLVQSDSIPEAYNDFIFTAIGEELGLIGCLVVFLLLGALCIRVVAVAHAARDDMGNYICMGVFGMILAQLIINIGMCTSVLPVIGVTLPFFSAGGTSLLCLFLGIGMCTSLLPVIGVTLPFFSAGGTSLCCLFSGVGLLLSVHLHKTSRTLYLHDNF